MKRKTPNWPALVQDGGWRERRKRGVFWTSYFRRYKRKSQEIYHEWNVDFGFAWILVIEGVVEHIGTLDECLYAAN